MSIIGVIEIPRGSSHKYEIDKETGTLILDRVIEQHYPANYGFIPNTLSEDGDPLDVFVLSENPIHPLVRVKLEILGVLEMQDNGKEDNKLICRLEGATHPYDPEFTQIGYFLRTYKSNTLINSINGKIRALELLEKAKERYEKS